MIYSKLNKYFCEINELKKNDVNPFLIKNKKENIHKKWII